MIRGHTLYLCYMTMQDVFPQNKIRSPAVAGLFYPETRSEIEAALCSFGLQTGVGGRAAAILVPHGAWCYSGHSAGAAFASAGGRARNEKSGTGVDTVVVLAAVHNPQYEGIFLSDSDFFETPLGAIPVHHGLCEEIVSCGTIFEVNDIPHLMEHTVEVLLPFITHCFPQVSLVPILVGSSRPAMIDALAHALAVVFSPMMESTLFIVSSIMSKHLDPEQARIQAGTFLKLLKEKKGAEILARFNDRSISACGAAAAAALLGSGLFDDMELHNITGTLSNAKEDTDETVYYESLFIQ